MTTLLIDFVEYYITVTNEERPIGRELSPRTRIYYLECVKSYAAYLKRPPTLEDLAPECVNKFIAWTYANRSAYTAKARRTGLRALLRFAKREGLTNADPDRLRRVYCERLQTKGYNQTDMEKLVAAARALRGRNIRFTGVPKSVYYSSLLMCMWNTGLRIGDIPEIEVAGFDAPKGRLFALEHKTRKSRWHKLHPGTAAAIAECIAFEPDRQFVWEGHRKRNLHRAIKAIIAAAGLTGSSRYIRRGAASELERLQPGLGWRFLNHSDPRVFDNHYRCADICEDESLAPPSLATA